LDLSLFFFRGFFAGDDVLDSCADFWRWDCDMMELLHEMIGQVLGIIRGGASF